MSEVQGSGRDNGSSVRLRRALPMRKMNVLMVLRSREASDVDARRADQDNRYAAIQDEIRQVKAFARKKNLDVVEANARQRIVRLRGTPEEFQKAFDVELGYFRAGDSTYLSHNGPISLPPRLADAVATVFNLDTRPIRTAVHEHGVNLELADFEGVSYTVPEVARLYDFPGGADAGKGQCVGLIMLDGGYLQSDIQNYFKKMGIAPPTIVCRNENTPSQDPIANYQVTQTVQIVGSVAPGAKIVLYNANKPGASADDLYELFNTAIYDYDNNPSVLINPSIIAESETTRSYLTGFDLLFEDAVGAAITLCSASGSEGALDSRVVPGQSGAASAVSTVPVVNYPASSPLHLACGGTALYANKAKTKVEREVVYNQLSRWLEVNDFQSNGGASGGGVSRFMPRPSYQAELPVPQWRKSVWKNGKVVDEESFAGRGVPDVAAVSDLFTGYQILFNGKWGIAGGTGISVPLWGGLIAQINEKLGWNVGFINHLLYQMQVKKNEKVLRLIDDGSNGVYVATPGAVWNPCCGLGVPNGQKLLEALRKVRSSAR